MKAIKRPDLLHGKFYHIYNRGFNNRNLFEKDAEYRRFLYYVNAFTGSVAEIFAWCLLKNHFHMLVRIKHEHEIGFLNSDNAGSTNVELKWKTYFPEVQTNNYRIKPKPKQQFQHVFDAYALWLNTRNETEGKLFQPHFERIEVNTANYFGNLVAYIHNNPVKHGFVTNAYDYQWSSYLNHLIQTHKSDLMCTSVSEYFATPQAYTQLHQIPLSKLEEPIQEFIFEVDE